MRICMRAMAGCRNQWIVSSHKAFLLALFCIGIARAETVTVISSDVPAAVARNNQGFELMRQGRTAEAEQLYRTALRTVSDDDLTRAKIASNLAELYRRQDRYRDAEIWYRSALQLRQKNLSAGSVDVAYSLNNLGEIYRAEGRDWEARNLMETAARSLQTFHSDAPGLPIVLSNFAVMLSRFGEYDQAEELLRSALNAYGRMRGPRSREYGITLSDLGQVLASKNQLDAAAPLYEQAIGIFENLGLSARSELASALANQGELYHRFDRPEDARSTEERALELLPPGGDALLRAQILRNIGNIVAGSKPADSVPYFERSLDLQEKILGAEHPATAGLLLEYASATQRAGNKSLARKLRKRAQDMIDHLGRQSLGQMTISLRDLRDNK
jgi:tetratricopeptide (TPR) repeat protein